MTTSTAPCGDTAAASASSAARRPPCWPDDNSWPKAPTKIELPSEKYLKAQWHAEILDVDSPNPHDRIIERCDPFVVRLRVELEGRLWRCICGHWCFNVGFTAIGKGEDFDLSDHLPDPTVLQLQNWKGCDTLCIDLCVTVPPDSIPVERCGTVYEIAAWFELRCCGDCADAGSHLAASGFERLGEYQFV
jgi:hypothetical protein